MVKNYYRILQVTKTATDDEIAEAYHQLVMEHYPNKKDNAYAARCFKEATEAFSVLSDSKKRDLYDRYGEEGLQLERASPNVVKKEENEVVKLAQYLMTDELISPDATNGVKAAIAIGASLLAVGVLFKELSKEK